jgi:hypothetical protein
VNVTAQDTIQDALRVLKALDPTETMAPEDADTGLRALNQMVDAMLLDEFFAYGILEITGTFAGKTASIGPGQTINTPRPVDMAPGSFYVKNSNGATLSYPLAKLTRAQYSAINYKDTPSEYPDVFYYDSAFPVAQISVCGVPAAPVEYHFMAWQQLSQFATLTTPYNWAPGYAQFLKLSLAELLAAEYGPMPAEAAAVLRRTRMAIKRVNAKVPVLNARISGPQRFNILSNQP